LGGAEPPCAPPLLAFAALLLVAPLASPQTTKEPEPPPEIDPYTKGEAAALAKLGYKSFGPFMFGRETTETVQRDLGGLPILWVETEHFLIGSTLEEYKPEKPEEIDDLKKELEALKSRLRDAPAKPKKLDPWLRLHLFAARLEQLYAEFIEVMGVLPKRDGKPGDGKPPALMLSGKFALLLTEKKSAMARFTRTYCGKEFQNSYSFLFESTGQLFFGVSNESIGGNAPIGDAELDYAVIYGIARNLLCAIEGFVTTPAPWWQHGVPLWFARERQPRVLLYTRPAGEALPPEELNDWQALARGRYEGGMVLDWSEQLKRQDWLQTPEFGENVVLWARVDYLLADQNRARALTAKLHGPSPLEGSKALAAATGKDLAALEADVKSWVLREYRKKRKAK
jgi:hypothetical protein